MAAHRAILLGLVIFAFHIFAPPHAAAQAIDHAARARPAEIHSGDRLQIPINADWRFHKGDAPGWNGDVDTAGWENVSLPHSWNGEDGAKPGTYYRGPGVYRKSFTLPAEARGKRLFVRFGAASTVAEVYFNGTKIGEHRGGFAAFCFELTAQARPGENNTLAVRVSNAQNRDVAPLAGDFNVYGGLIRPAELFLTDGVCITPLDDGSSGVFLKLHDMTNDVAHVQVVVEVDGGDGRKRAPNAKLSITFVARDATGHEVARATQPLFEARADSESVTVTLAIAKPHPWNGRGDAYLYSMDVEIARDGTVIDRVTQPLGLRTIAFDNARGLLLNGKPIKLQGVNRHEDWPGVGRALSQEQNDRDMQLIMEIGANAVRCAHYQHSDYFYGLCDTNGLLAWAELPLVNTLTLSTAFEINARQQLRELIKQNYNHPSIYCWSLFNELQLGGRPAAGAAAGYGAMIERLNALAHELDPTRPTIAASNQPNFTQINKVPDLLGGNLYSGWYYDDAPKMKDEIDKALSRGKLAGTLMVSEYGAGGALSQHEENPRRPEPYGKWHPEEYESLAHEAYWGAIKNTPGVWGSLVWNMFDFAVSSRNEGDTPARNDKGLVSYDRETRKDVFYLYKANWSSEPVLYITSRRYTQHDESHVDVKVYSNASAVRLRINGKDLGEIKGDDVHAFLWKQVALAPGENKIEVTAQRDGEALHDECVWAFTPTE